MFLLGSFFFLPSSCPISWMSRTRHWAAVTVSGSKVVKYQLSAGGATCCKHREHGSVRERRAHGHILMFHRTERPAQLTDWTDWQLTVQRGTARGYGIWVAVGRGLGIVPRLRSEPGCLARRRCCHKDKRPAFDN